MSKAAGAILVSVLLSVCAFADAIDAADWELRKDQGGIVISQRVVANSSYKETHGIMQSDASLFAILAVLKDSLNCSKWLYECKHSEVVEQRGTANNTVYTIIDAPLLLKDRDLYVHSNVQYFPNEGRIEIVLTGDENFQPEKRKRVRVLNFTGQWTVEKTDTGSVSLSYQVHSNPQISLAKTVNNTMVTSVYETLRDVSALAQQEPYRSEQPGVDELKAISADPGHP